MHIWMETEYNVTVGNLSVVEHWKKVPVLACLTLKSRLCRKFLLCPYVIRDSGGHRDNPYVSEFRASFRFIAVNKVFVPVFGTNC